MVLIDFLKKAWTIVHDFFQKIYETMYCSLSVPTLCEIILRISCLNYIY